MLEETDSPPPATDPQPSGFTSASERGYQAAVFILIAVAVVLVTMLVLDSTGGFGRGSDSNSGTGTNSTSPPPPAALTANPPPAAPAAPGPGATASINTAISGQNPGLLGTRLQEDAAALASLVTEMQAALTQKQEELNGTVILYTTATRQVEQLNAQLEQSLRDSADAETLRGKLSRAVSLLDTAERRANALEQQLAAAPDKGIFEALQSSLDEADKMRAASGKKASDLESRLKGMVSADLLNAANAELAAVQKRLVEITPENEKLRYEIQRLRAELNRTRLFVDKVDDLPAAAKMLFVELSKLETANPGELLTEYERIESELNVDVVDTISFATGSSQINLDKVAEIRRSIRASGTDSYFLVVGYASKTGDLQTNKQLSAERATTIASVTDANKDEGQGVNAVFLGQTDRFSPANVLSNQVCEIWEIRK